MAEEDTGPRCTAGWGLVGIKKIVHDMFMLNELKGGYGAYKVSYAGAKDPKNNESGLSYALSNKSSRIRHELSMANNL